MTHRYWRKLLKMDVPAPYRTEQDLAAEVERNYRWNFTVNLLDGVSYGFGWSFAFASTILPVFINKLSPNPLLLGILAVLAQAGPALPQLFVAAFTERIARRKAIVINLGFFAQRFPTLLFPAAALIAMYSPTLAVAAFLLLYAWHSLGGGVSSLAWQDLVARCFPVTRRGRFFGIVSFLGTITGIFGAIGSSHILHAYPFPTNFVIIFGIVGVFVNLSWVFLSLTREPVQGADPSARSGGQFWDKWQRILRYDRNFRHYLQARFLFGMGMMGVGFVSVAAIERWHISDSVAGFFTVALFGGQAIGNLASGVLADRFGHKLSLQIGVLVLAAAWLLAWMNLSAMMVFVVFILIGFAFGANNVSGVMISMEFSTQEHRPTYMGISNTVWGIGSGIAPLIGGMLARFGYDWLFFLSMTANLISLAWWMWYVAEPRYHVQEKVLI